MASALGVAIRASTSRPIRLNHKLTFNQQHNKYIYNQLRFPKETTTQEDHYGKELAVSISHSTNTPT
jgi:hypothetical protein